MIRRIVIISLVLLSSTLHAYKWSRNDVIKFSPVSIGKGYDLLEYDNIGMGKDYFWNRSSSNAWMATSNIFIPSEYLAASASINMEGTGTNSKIILTVKDSQTDEILRQKSFLKSGYLQLDNMFIHNIYLSLDIIGEDTRLYSISIKRKPGIIIQKGNTVVNPINCFMNEDILLIKFNLLIPGEADIMIFTYDGVLVDYIIKQELLNEGVYEYTWDPHGSTRDNLKSGEYIVFIRITAKNGKIRQVTRKFNFIHR